MTQQLSSILRGVTDSARRQYVSFWCPGCDEAHPVRVRAPGVGGDDGAWEWNGSVDKPTLRPSVLVTNGCKTPNHIAGTPCWCSYNREQRAKGEGESFFTCGTCHSFVTDGRIEFLGDCTHDLAGQTVDLPAWRDGRGY